MNLQDQIISGAAWRSSGRVINQAVQFCFAVVLARLLTPEDYGIVAMAMVFLSFAGIFDDFGLSVALIQRKEITKEQEVTVFWTTLGIGCVIVILFWAASSAIANFYNEPLLKKLIPVMALAFVIMPIGVVQRALLLRRMDFRSIAFIEVGTTAATGGAGIALALNGFGVWSLVISSILGKVVNCTLTLWRCRWSPRFIYDINAFKTLFKFGGNLTAYGVINHLGQSMDRLLIGKFMGAQSVGIYGRANALMLTPFTQVVWVLTSVLFPAFSSIQDDKERIKRIFLRALSLTAFLVTPMLFGLIVVARPFVLVVLGEQWLDAAPVLQVFCLIGLVQMIIHLIGPIIESQGRTDLLVKLVSFQTIMTLSGISTGLLMKNLEAVAVGFFVANFLVLSPYIKFGGGMVGVKLNDVLQSVSGSIVCSMLMGVGVWSVNKFLLTEFSAWKILVINICIGIVFYTLLVMLIKPSGLHDVLSLIKDRISEWRLNK